MKNKKSCVSTKSLEEVREESRIRKEKWYMKYFYYPFFWYIVNPYIEVRYFIKCFIQRRIRGFDDGDFWDMEEALKKWFTPRFERFIKLYGCECYKPYGTSQKKWEEVINKISWWLKDSEKEYHNAWYGENKDNESVSTRIHKFQEKEKEAIKLLKKHLFDFGT